MISHIEGRVAEKRAGELVLDVNGVGFLLLCPASTIAAIIADEAAIGMVNSKTTAVRIIPAPGKTVGD